MDYGRFFMLHPQADVTRKPVLFFYLPLRGGKGSRFPVYLAFYQNKINFYFDGHLKMPNDTEQETEQKNDTAEDKKYCLAENDLLLSLDLTPDPVAQERLNSLLADAFKRDFPIAKMDIDLNSDIGSEEFLFDVKTYKGLDVFNKKQGTTINPPPPSKKLLFRDLILDFLFEAGREDSVFSACKQFTHIKSLMNQSFFLTALMQKAEFYYLVENYNVKNPGYSFGGEKNIYKKKLIRAQNLWLNSLHQADSHKVINEGNNWFDDVETETECVFKTIIKQNIHKGDLAYKKALLKHQRNSAKWTLYRTAIFKAWSLLLTFILIGVSSVFDKMKNISIKKFALKITISLLALFVLFIIVFLVSKNIFVVLSILAIIYFVITLIFASIFRVLDIVLLRLMFLVAGATYFAFEIAGRFNYYFVKNTWTTFRLNFSFIPNWGLIIFILSILAVSYLILLDNEKKNHPNLSSGTSKWKVGVLMGFILFFSFTSNVLLMNTKHFRKELFEDNLLISEIWSQALGENKGQDNSKEFIEHSKNEHQVEHNLRYVFRERVSGIEKEKAPINELYELVDKMENPRFNHEREHLFNEYLTHIIVKDEHDTELYPLVEEHDIFGYKLHIVPPVLYFNIFLTLFLVVFIQVIIHHKKVVEGGHFE